MLHVSGPKNEERKLFHPTTAVSAALCCHSRTAGACALLVLVAMLCGDAATAGEPQVIDVPIGGVQHFDGMGQSINVVLDVPVPADAVILGVGWSGTLTTFDVSWVSDATISLSDGDQQPEVIVRPGEGHDEPSPTGTPLNSGGIVHLGDLGIPGYPINGGVIKVEFSESWVDLPGEPESEWSANSTFSIMYEIIPAGGCTGDLNGDGVVNVADMLDLLSQWGDCPGQGGCPGDLDGSGSINVADLLILLQNWGPCPPSSTIGACCYEDGTCDDMAASACQDVGGTYQGDFTFCENWACPQPPSGATCFEAIPIALNDPVMNDSTGNAPDVDVPVCGQAVGPTPNSGILWYLVEGDGTTLTARTCGSEMETSISVYCGTTCLPSSIECVAGNQFGDCDDPFQATVSWCSAEGGRYYVAVWGEANIQGNIALEVESGTACSNPAQCQLACDEWCGEFNVELNCWCDPTLCPLFGDCCDALCDSCPDQPTCTTCDSAPCPPGATQEGEQCGDSINGGCNTDMNNPPMSSISCNETICGTVWASGGSRDTDWFRLDLSDQQDAVEKLFELESDVDLEFFITEEGCDGAVIFERMTCDLAESICLMPGVYELVVRPVAIDGLPCSAGPHRYTLSSMCLGGCATLPDSCVDRCGEEAPAGCWCDDECFLFGDCCDDICDECPGSFGC